MTLPTMEMRSFLCSGVGATGDSESCSDNSVIFIVIIVVIIVVCFPIAFVAGRSTGGGSGSGSGAQFALVFASSGSSSPSFFQFFFFWGGAPSHVELLFEFLPRRCPRPGSDGAEEKVREVEVASFDNPTYDSAPAAAAAVGAEDDNYMAVAPADTQLTF